VAQLRAVILGNFKLIENTKLGKHKLFDLAADPEETKNLVSTRPEIVQQLMPLLNQWSQSLLQEGELPSPVDLTDAERDRLRALGYVEE
jgi:hypothetical protein